MRTDGQWLVLVLAQAIPPSCFPQNVPAVDAAGAVVDAVPPVFTNEQKSICTLIGIHAQIHFFH